MIIVAALVHFLMSHSTSWHARREWVQMGVTAPWLGEVKGGTRLQIVAASDILRTELSNADYSG